jgi:hypothetical protein
VFAGDGAARLAIMPWLDATTAAAVAAASAAPSRPQHSGPGRGAHVRYSAATELAAELLLNGIRRTGTRDWPGWSRAVAETEERGYHRMAAALREVQAGDGAGAALGMLKLLALARDAG